MKLMNKCKKAAILATVLGGICFGASVDAATILVGGGTDYKTGTQLGVLTGSWVTSNVDATVVKDKAMSWFNFDVFAYDYYVPGNPYKYFYDYHPDYVNETRTFEKCYDELFEKFSSLVDKFPHINDVESSFLAPDVDVYRIVINGKTYACVRQTSGTGTVKMDGLLIDPSMWTDVGTNQYKGETDSVNAHAAAGKGKFVYLADYTKCQIGVGEISADGKTIGNRSDLTINLRENLTKNAGLDFSDGTYYLHGESMLVDGDYLYVLVNVNKDSEWSNYQPSYLIKYAIQANGALQYLDHTTMGLNTDTVRIAKHNDYMFTTAIGGYQNYGEISENSSLDFVNIGANGLFGKNGKIKLPSNVTANPSEFRNMRILPNGTAYVLCYGIKAGGYATAMVLYKTTVSNLLASQPMNWEVVNANDNVEGWFNDIDAEYYTKRVWVRKGNYLELYVDGVKVSSWHASEFASSDMFTTLQSFEVMTPEEITGKLAKLELALGEQAANNANAVWNANANGTVETITADKALIGDVTISADASKVDLANNILGVVYAKDNNISITAGNLQLQSENTVATPVGIYAGNGKEVNITADKVNIITKGYEGGNSLTNAIWLDPNATGEQAKITIDAPVNISMTGGYGGNGIAIQKTDRWGESSTAAAKKAEVIIKGDVSVKGADNETWGIGVNSENVFSRFNNAGILTAVNNSSVTVDGNVYLDVYGNGITTTAEGSTVTVNGGEITVPTGMNYGYYSLASYLGTINMNTSADGATPGKETVKLDGDIFALNTGNINLALTTEESYLNGVIDSAGNTNLWLKNGAMWTNEANNSRYYLDNEDVGSLANNSIKASHINNFVGASTMENAGAIYQGLHSSNIQIDNYSGNAVVLYERDASDNITGGTITIGNAEENSIITLRTDYSDSLADEANRNKVMDDLADKLFYTAYTTGQTNLTGTVEIAEGLLTNAITKYYSGITFDSATGQGDVLGNAYERPKVEETFSDNIYGDDLTRVPFDSEYSDLIEDVNGKTVLNFGKLDDSKSTNEKVDVIVLRSALEGWSEGAIASDWSGEGEVNIEMGGKELEVITTANDRDANGIYAIYDGSVTINNAGNIKITANSESGSASAIYAAGDEWSGTSKVEITTAEENNVITLEATGVTNDKAVLHANNDAKVIITGKVDIGNTNGNEAVMVGSGSEVKLGGGVIGGENDDVAIRLVDDGKITINEERKHKVVTNGDIVFGTKDDDANKQRAVFALRAAAPVPASVERNAIYNVNGSAHNGDIVNNTTDTKNFAVEFSGGADWNGNALGVNMDVLLSGEGTVWTGYYDDEGVANTALALEIKDGALWQVEDKPVVARSGNTIKVKTMQGTGGFVAMGNDAMNIENYSGATTFIYENTDGNITGGNLTVEKVDADKATLNLRTNDIGTNDKDKVAEVLGKLASKLYYAEADQTTQGGVATASNEEVKLSGQLQIAEGLLTTDKLISFGNLQFGNDGKALVDEASISFNESGNTGGGSVSYEENTMVRSAKSAMASSVMMWRNESDDVMQRMGDLRLGTEDSGIWAKYYNGNASYNENNTNYSSDYKAYQVGYDKKLENGWIVGAALSYNDAEHKYAMGAKGEGEAVSVSAYGAWNNDKGHFANVIVKGSKLDNEYNSFDMYKDHELKGDYSTWGVSVSAEYGRRIEQSNGFYFEPSAKLTIGRVQDTQYSASTDFTSAITGSNQDMYIEQAGFNSIVGELGVGMGKRLDRGTVYTKLAVAHEFAGDFNTTYMDENSNMVKSNVDFGGSWFEWQIGGNVKMSDNSYFYATYEKAFGGDAALDWRVDAGMRWTF